MSGTSSARISSVRAFNRFYTQKIGVLADRWLDSEYSLTEVRVLYELAQRKQPLASDLVRDLSLDAGYLSRMLAKFSRRGWLKRERSAGDARKAHLNLTSKGRAVFEMMEGRSRDSIGSLLAPLSCEQQVRLQGHLQGAQALLSGVSAENQDITLRQHRAGDMGWIIGKHGELYTQEYGWNSNFEGLVAEICAKFLRDFAPTCERCWIAERAGVAVGCIMLVRHSPTVAKLRLLLVDPSQRGMGVGNALIGELLRFAREVGYQKITLWTQSVLTAARRLYEAHGFKHVSSEPHAGFGAALIGETWELAL